jgi:hypothetical protein
MRVLLAYKVQHAGEHHFRHAAKQYRRQHLYEDIALRLRQDSGISNCYRRHENDLALRAGHLR